MKGFNFSLEVPNTIHTIETKILNKEDKSSKLRYVIVK